MASSLAESIGNNFLQCGICLEQYKDPRVLPCHHGFCRRCLEEYVACNKEKQSLACPLCSKVVKLSKRGVHDLPVHFLVKSLRDAVEMDKSEKTPSSGTNCTNCDVNNKAKVRCFDCKEYLCDSCHTSHKMLKAMRNHRVVSIEDILNGKVDIMAEERSICKEHKERHKYYCKDEKRAVCQDCVILKTCQTEHDRITIDEAAQEKSEELEGLMKKTNDILKNFCHSVEEVNVVEKELENNSQIANDALDRVEQEYIKSLKKTVTKLKDEIKNIKEERMKELNRKKTNLRSTMKDIEKTNEDVTRVMQSPYKTEVISSHATLLKKLRTVSKYHPHKVDKMLGYIRFEAAISSLPNMGQLFKDSPERSWELIRNFRTGDFDNLHGLAIDQDDDIVVCSWNKGVKVFTRNGDVKSTLYDYTGSVDIAVLPGKKYASAPHDIKGIKICDSQGQHAITFHTTNVNKVLSEVNSLTVDSDNEIIVGQCENTISIHNTDGSLISNFATQSMPFRLAVTSNGDIVSSFYDEELEQGTYVQLMDYSGGNVRIIQPPDEVVKEWCPGFVCCGPGEIFVSNEGRGDPHGVYRFTSEGDNLGCVTTQVRNPQGIALSRDGRELFVADHSNASHVKIFQRP